jgi:hypothetical protein
MNGDSIQAKKKLFIKLIFAKALIGLFISYPCNMKHADINEQTVSKKTRIMMDFHIGFSENLRARFVMYLSIIFIIPNRS